MRLAKSRLKKRGMPFIYKFLFLETFAVVSIATFTFFQIRNLSKSIDGLSNSILTHSVVLTEKTKQREKSYNEQVVQYILDVFGDDADEMISIIRTCENKGLKQSVINYNNNGSYDAGLAQINSIHFSGSEFAVCKKAETSWKANIDCAKAIKDKYGFSAWSCSEAIGVTPFYKK